MPTNMPSQHARCSSPTSVSLSAHPHRLEAEARRVSGCIVSQVPSTSCSHLPVTRKMFQRVVSHPLACCFGVSMCTQSQTSMLLMLSDLPHPVEQDEACRWGCGPIQQWQSTSIDQQGVSPH